QGCRWCPQRAGRAGARKQMASPTSVVNMALTRIGHAPIDDLAEDSAPARLASLIFDDQRDFVQADFPWIMCREVQALAEMPNDREYDWIYKYQRPSCLRFLRVWPYQAPL